MSDLESWRRAAARREMRPGEFELIARYFAPLASGFPGAGGLRDDLATVAPSTGCELAVTVDTMVSGIHFLADDPPDLIARKLLRVNLSDLASAGARPVCYLVAMSLDAETDGDWVRRFADGLAEDQAIFGVSLAGGDTTSTPGPLTLSLTAIGEVPVGRAVRRVGASEGDDVWVSGTIGDAALALVLLERTDAAAVERDHPDLLARYRLPQPRTGLGTRLLGIASAMADISDGLAADLGHICQESGVGADLAFADIPLSGPARALLHGEPDGGRALFGRVIGGGDDYELVFTAAPDREADIREKAAEAEVPVARIGAIRPGEGVSVFDDRRRAIDVTAPGWQHF